MRRARPPPAASSPPAREDARQVTDRVPRRSRVAAAGARSGSSAAKVGGSVRSAGDGVQSASGATRRPGRHNRPPGGSPDRRPGAAAAAIGPPAPARRARRRRGPEVRGRRRRRRRCGRRHPDEGVARAVRTRTSARSGTRAARRPCRGGGRSSAARPRRGQRHRPAVPPAQERVWHGRARGSPRWIEADQGSRPGRARRRLPARRARRIAPVRPDGGTGAGAPPRRSRRADPAGSRTATGRGARERRVSPAADPRTTLFELLAEGRQRQGRMVERIVPDRVAPARREAVGLRLEPARVPRRPADRG